MAKLGDIKVGSFLAGSFNKLILRQKSDEEFELGQLFVSGESAENFSIFKINDIRFASQIPVGSIELMAGYQLERENADLRIHEPELRMCTMTLAANWKCLKSLPQGKSLQELLAGANAPS